MTFDSFRFWPGVAVVALGWGLSAGAAAEQKTDVGKTNAIPIAKLRRSSPVDFEKEILPILKNNCLACHNQTKAKADLVLETPQSILKGGESGPAVVARKSEQSLLLRAAAHWEKPFMPPKDNKAAASDLTPEELALVKLWIDQGAKGEVRGGGPIAWQPLPDGLNPILAVALTSDGQFAACSRANQIFVYHVPSGQLVGRLNDPQLLKSGLYKKPGTAHRDLVESLAFSPGGDLLASGSYREVKLWRHPRNVQKLSFAAATPRGLKTVTVSPDGKWIATGGDDHVVKLWSAANGRLAKEFPGHTAAILALRFSPDNTKLVSTSTDKSLRVWSVADGKTLAQTTTSSEVNAVVWIPGAKQIASGSADGLIRVWRLPNSANGELDLLKELQGHEGAVTALEAVTQDAARSEPRAPKGAVAALEGQPGQGQLLSGGADGTVRCWDVEKGTTVRTLKHGGPVAAVAARADGKRFASAGRNNVAKLWDAQDGQELAELKGDRYARETVAALDRNLAAAKAEVDYRKTTFQSATNQHRSVVERVKKATDTNAAMAKVFVEKEKAYTNAIAAKASAETALEDLGPEVKKLADALEEAEKAAADSEAAAKTAKDKKDAKAEKLALEAEAKKKSVEAAKAALDALPAEVKEKRKQALEKLSAGTKALTEAEREFKKSQQTKSTAEHELELATNAGKKAAASVAEAESAIGKAEGDQNKTETELESAKKAAAASEKPILTLAFSPDNLTLATAGEDQMVHTWSAENGTAFETWKGHKGAVTSLAFTRDGTLVSGALDGSAIVWDLTPAWTLERVIGTGEAASQLVDRVNALRFTPDGKTLATGGGEPTRGGEIKLWQVSDGKLVKEFKNVHSDAVFALDFTPDGKYLASGAADKFARVVEVASGKVVKAFEGHTHHVLGVSWKRDGRTLATAGADNVIKVWDLVSGERRKNVEGFSKEVTSICFIPGTDQAVASSGDSTVSTVNEKGEKVRTFTGASDFMHASAVTPDGRI
ncbi:MAG TPA: c-type cytochrome domain-containing protein, partial [Verrucomicrobiae bacterium]